ncbi:hypothetical protein F2Q69_00043127 [Brassica cretica]|uniref:Uncharacterized protein n=1 Tax=Brassica cretica TaxID=69181 RepID=A0A8S9NSU5_BRACR|nr:hypothetical protein F2Q69_00043127 [Brassica cretica]
MSMESIQMIKDMSEITVSPSIDTHLHQASQKRASTDIAYYLSIDTGVDRAREGDYSIGNWEDNHHHESYAVESYAVETAVHELGADELHEGFTYEELLNMQRRDEPDQHRAQACGERTSFSHSFEKANRPSINDKPKSSIDIRSKPPSTMDMHCKYPERTLQTFFRWLMEQIISSYNNTLSQPISRGLQMSSMTQTIISSSRHPTRPSIDIDVPSSIDTRPEFGRRAYDRDGTRRSHWEEKDEYGVYRDDQGHARDVDGHIIRVSKDDIRSLLERASRDEHNYICLPEHASSFTQTKLVPEIYTKDEINEMFYGVCGAQEENESDFQMKLYGVYYPLNDSISWLTSCMEEMRQDIARIQTQRAAEANAPASIDTHLHQASQKRASTDIAYYLSIDTGVDRAREGDYSIGNWEDNHHHESYAVESYAVETAVHELGADELHEGFIYEELLNMQRRDEPDQHQAEACGEKTSFSHSFEKANRPSINDKPKSSIDIRPKPPSTTIISSSRHPTRPSIDIDVPSSIDTRPEFGRRAYDRDGTRRSHWAEKDEYGVYRDDQGHARDVDGHIIRVSKDDIRSLLERASRDVHNYICLPEHASLFTQVKLVPEIYTKDEINEMFYGVCGAQEKNESDFQMKLYGVYYPLNDSISWLTSCMEEMRQDIARIQTQRAAEANAPASIDSHHSTSIDDNPQHSHSMKSQPDFHTLWSLWSPRKE